MLTGVLVADNGAREALQVPHEPSETAATAASEGAALASGAAVPTRSAKYARRSWTTPEGPLSRLAVRYATIFAFALMVLYFSLSKPAIFPTLANARSILDNAAPTLILAVGLTAVLIAGEFDLSFTGVVPLASVLAIKTMVSLHQGAGLAIAVGILVGLLAGVVGGALVAAQRASSFITTLALGSVWTGIALGLSSGGQTINTTNNTFANLSFHHVVGLPITIVYAAVVSLIIWLVLRWTVFGRNAQAIGSNPIAARFAGLGLGGVRVGVFVVMGLCAGIAAILLSSTNAGFSPDVGSGLLVPPFVATFFGLSVRAAGRFNVFGTIVGTLFIATLQTGLNMLGASAWLADVVVGVALVIILFVATERVGSR